MAAGDDGNYRDVFVRDLILLTTTRISLDTGGLDPDDNINTAAISGNGRYASFTTQASDIVATDSNVSSDCFVAPIP